MISFPIGLILTSVVFVLSVGLENLSLYYNYHSLLIVLGGTATIFLFTTPTGVIKNLFRETFHLFKPTKNWEIIKNNLVQVSKSKTANSKTDNELIDYAQELWSQGVAADLFVVLLSQKKRELEQRSVNSIQSLKNLAKYPPALGMAGTVMGIVSLFQSLDAGKDKIGPALALAMTATFFGLVIANALVMPLADRLQVKHIEDKNYLLHIYQILLLINQNEAQQLIEEEILQRGA